MLAEPCTTTNVGTAAVGGAWGTTSNVGLCKQPLAILIMRGCYGATCSTAARAGAEPASSLPRPP
eukprot:12422672-Prorocentrum_lima.AAC.1